MGGNAAWQAPLVLVSSWRRMIRLRCILVLALCALAFPGALLAQQQPAWEMEALTDQGWVEFDLQTGLEIELNPALIGEGFHFPRRLLLSQKRARKRQGAQGEHEYAAESNHSALGANQNQRSLPSGISSHFNRTGVPQLRPSWHVNCGHPFRNKLMAAK